MAETEKHGFSSPAGQRQQEKDSIAPTPTISSDPPLPTSSIKKREEGVLSGSLDIILPSEVTEVVREVPKPKCAWTARAIRKENRGEKAAAQRDGEKSWNWHQQNYLVNKNEGWQRSQEKETTKVRERQ